MRVLRELLRRHVGKFLAASVVVAIGIALTISPPLRASALSGWNNILAWAGLAEASVDTDEVFWCPMHPQIKRNRANEVCPICNMALVKLDGGRVKDPKFLTLTAQQVQQAGVVTKLVKSRKLYREIDTTGRFDYDERRYAGISSWIPGKSRIEKLYVSFTGEHVTQGAPMAELYSPELITAQTEYLIAVELLTRRQSNARNNENVLGSPLLDSVRQKLLHLGLTRAQIDQLQNTRKVLDRIPIHAPISGTVIERHVQQGQYVDEGDWLFHLADLTHLWLLADIYEEELPLVEVGGRAALSVRALPGKTFPGTVSFIDPMLDTKTRTARVRIEVENEGRKLKPGMYARVRLRHELSPTLAVPEDAVLWSGQRTVVLLKLGEGIFQPREVRLGNKWLYALADDSRQPRQLEFGGDRTRYHEVLMGLAAGDEVVTSGAFLLNAESKFQNVLAKMLPATSETMTLEQLLDEKTAQRLRKLLDAYHALSEALARDELKSVPTRANDLADAAAGLARQAVAEKKDKLAIAAQTVAEAARAVATSPPKNLKLARTGFGEISRATVGLLTDFGAPALLNKELFVFECPMAGPFGYKLWLRPNRDMQNPYMGQKMPNCGSRVESLRK